MTRVSALVALPLSLVVPLAACSPALDQAHSVQTRLGRIDGVTATDVATPSADTGAAIRVSYTGAGTERELAHLIAEIDKVADDEGYPSYRLELDPVDSDGDRLVVDDAFADSPAAATVLGNWLAVTAALLGDVAYTFEPGSESIVVDAGAGIAHDVGEASRVRYGFRDTSWTFENGGTVFVAAGRLSPSDVLLFQGVQRTVSSQVLPCPAPAWRLERRDDHVLLDLDVACPDSPVAPERLTIRRYGDDVQRLVTAALDSVRGVGLPVWLRLVNPTAAGNDVFGYWVSGQRPVRGRDRLMRGWDLWLVDAARTVGG